MSLIGFILWSIINEIIFHAKTNVVYDLTMNNPTVINYNNNKFYIEQALHHGEYLVQNRSDINSSRVDKCNIVSYRIYYSEENSMIKIQTHDNIFNNHHKMHALHFIFVNFTVCYCISLVIILLINVYA